MHCNTMEFQHRLSGVLVNKGTVFESVLTGDMLS